MAKVEQIWLWSNLEIIFRQYLSNDFGRSGRLGHHPACCHAGCSLDVLVPADRTKGDWVRWPARNINSVDAARRAMVTACVVSADSIGTMTSVSVRTLRPVRRLPRAPWFVKGSFAPQYCTSSIPLSSWQHLQTHAGRVKEKVRWSCPKLH